jgi:(p)ppGpp synthase/HD superfamily hydrolase
MYNLQKAINFAKEAHGDQKYGEHEYSKHLQDVSDVLTRFCLDVETYPFLHEAAWLHDTVEDTHISIIDISNNFSNYVSHIVWCVTSDQGDNRKERNSKTYKKIKLNYYAIILKLADRIANVENCIKTNSDLLKMYKKEYKEFKKQLYTNDIVNIQLMFKHLDKLLE